MTKITYLHENSSGQYSKQHILKMQSTLLIKLWN